MWWIIGIVVYILSFFAIWLFIIQDAKTSGEEFETIGDLVSVLEDNGLIWFATLSFLPFVNTLLSVILGFALLLQKISKIKIN